MADIKDITIAICTLNAEKTIVDVLNSCINNCDSENLIIVDGHSKDETVRIASKYTSKIYYDPGKGLAAARNIALDNCNTSYIFYVGPDNIIPKEHTAKLLQELKDNNWVGISSTSFFSNPKNYYEKSFNLYKKTKYFPGEKRIIGTPWMYDVSLLKALRWNEINSYSDDTELCERLIEKNKKIGISRLNTIEIGTLNSEDLKARWNMYGKSDFQFYKSNGRKNKKLIKRIRSFFNAIVVDLYTPLFSKQISLLEKFYILPFLLKITTVRHTRFLTLILKK